MTQLLETLRNNIMTSLYGRRLGLDKDQFLVGTKALKVATQTLTSGTTATEIPNYGATNITVTTAAASTASSVGTTEVGLSWAMEAPAEGVEKLIYLGLTTTGRSTAGGVVRFGTGVTAYDSSITSSATGAKLDGTGAWLRLWGLSTAQWMVLGKSTSTSVVSS
jgi:hypothetical protein